MKIYDMDTGQETEADCLPETTMLGMITEKSFGAAVQDKKVLKRSINASKNVIDTDSTIRSNKADSDRETSNADKDKTIATAKMEADEAHCARHKAVLNRWGITETIPKGIAIVCEIFGYTLQFLFMFSVGWLVYVAKYAFEHFSGLDKKVWKVIWVAVGLVALALVVWGAVELFKFLLAVPLPK